MDPMNTQPLTGQDLERLEQLRVDGQIANWEIDNDLNLRIYTTRDDGSTTVLIGGDEAHQWLNTPAAPPTAASPGKTVDWHPGDLVLAADGHLWVRAYPEDAAKGWPWGHSTETVGATSGAVEEGYPVRPLTLLVRGGRPVGGIVVAE